MPRNAGEKKKEQILKATLEVIAEEGVDAVTHRRVGKQAGESHGVVGYHFTTRDSLIHSSFKFYFGSFRELMTDSGWDAEKKMSPQQIVNALGAMIAYEVENPSATLVEQEMILVAARNPELAELYRDWEKQGVEIFIAGLKKTGYQEPRRLALKLLNFTRGFLLESLTDPTLTVKHFKERARALLKMSDRKDAD